MKKSNVKAKTQAKSAVVKSSKPKLVKTGTPLKAPPAPARKPAITSLETDLVRQLAGVLNETGLSEIEYDSAGVRIRVSRHAAGVAITAPPGPMYMQPASVAPEPPATARPADPATHAGTVKSPMVGVFYLLPEPGAVPFIKVGDLVAEGQTLGLIEAMKTFNPVKAPRAGKVIKIVADNGSPVEYGEPLVIVE